MTKDWYLDNLDKMLGYVHTLEGMVSDYQTDAKKDGYDTIAHLSWKITTSLGDIENLMLECVSRLDSVEDNEIESSRKPIKSGMGENGFGFFKIKDYAKENNLDPNELLDMVNRYGTDKTLNNEIFIDELDWCKDHINRRHKMGLYNSRKPIKSSLEDRLVPYLEEFEEGYSSAIVDDPMDDYAGVDTTQSRLKTFYKTFKNDHNLTDDDINALENAVFDMWHETDTENTEHDMGEMYGAPYGATPEEALKVFESRKAIKSSRVMDYNQFQNVCTEESDDIHHFHEYNGAYFVILGNQRECEFLNKILRDKYGFSTTYYKIIDPHNGYFGYCEIMCV